MDKLAAMHLFVRLADLGSFTRVADEMNASKSMVSKKISLLEAELGTRLIHRSTRRVQLTDIGEGYLERCRALLMQMEDADNFVQSQQGAPRGKLRVNVPMALGTLYMGQAFAEFMTLHPEITLDVHQGDEPMDLIEHGFDLGIRAASRQFDSAYIARKFTSFSYKVCASPDYLETHGTPEDASDLEHHNCFIYSYFRGGDQWPLGDGVRISGTLKVNNTPFMLECIKAGLGIGFLPSFVAYDALKTGDIVEVLSPIARPELTLYAMYPDRRHAPPRLTVFIDFLQNWFKGKAALWRAA